MALQPPSGPAVHMKAAPKAARRLQCDWADCTLPQFTLGGSPRQFDSAKAAEAAVLQYYNDEEY